MPCNTHGMNNQRHNLQSDSHDDQSSFALYAAARLVVQSYRPYLDALGVTYPQYMVIQHLHRGGPQTVTQIADKLYLDAGTVTPILKRLEKRGWLSRQRCTDDERMVFNRLTPNGHTLAIEGAKASHSALNRGRLREDWVRPLVTEAKTLLKHLAF